MRPTDCTDALRAVAELGPYFAVEHATVLSDWLPLSTLTDSSDHTLLRARVDVVRAALATLAACTPGDIDLRAAASTHALALCSRLVAPALATATLHGIVIRVEPSTMLWRPVPSGPVPMALSQTEAVAAVNERELAELLHEHVLTTVVAPLVDAFSNAFHLSEQVLWGNVASALAGSATMIGHARRADGAAAASIVAAACTTPLLAGYGSYQPRGGFARTNCCLFYRVPGGGYCGDCVLAR